MGQQNSSTSGFSGIVSARSGSSVVAMSSVQSSPVQSSLLLSMTYSAVISGVPGTGKTATILEVMNHLQSLANSQVRDSIGEWFLVRLLSLT